MNIGSSSHVQLEQSKFRGLYSRGNGEVVPDAFFSDCLNNKFSTEAVSSRDGLVTTPSLTASNIVRAVKYKRLGESQRWVWLDNLGNLYDSLYYPTAIHQDVDITDFSAVNYANRLYISPHNRIEGAPGKSVLVYEGDGVVRLAAGVAPSGYTITAVEAATSGTVEAGIHLIAVVYITASGFITAPGSSIAQMTATGGKDIDVAGIPVSGTKQKYLLATRSIPISQFSGNLFGYEFFFVPGAALAAAATTATISFYDADLIESADYLFDNLATIPAGVNIFVYNGRLGVVSEDGNNYSIRLSERGEPETFNALDGYLTVDPSDGGSGLKNAFEHRKSLILTSSDRFYATSDNDAAPNTWQINCIDKSAGAECFCVATILDSRGLQFDRAFIADRSGLLCFEGMVVRPEMSWNIDALWKRINKAKMNLVQIADDPIYHRLIISVPLDAATAISHILYADYSEAFTVYKTIDPNMIKWSIWTFPTAPVSIAGDKDETTGKSVFHFALAGGNIYTMKEAIIADFANAIESYWKSSFKEAKSGYINHFAGIKFRATGSGVCQISLYGEDDALPETIPPITFTLAPGIDYDSVINYVNERMSIRFRMNLINEYYTFNRLDVWSKPVWLRRPG